jgi:predicted O-methyltransferase YrrM
MQELEWIHPPDVLDAIVEKTKPLGFDMASEPKTGALLRTLAASKPGGCFLELGTGTGIATSWILAGMCQKSSLTSVDTDETVQQVARQFLASDTRLTLHLEDGLTFLTRQPESSYDFVFADAMPGKYEGLESALKVVKPGGFYVIDDMLPQANWPSGHADRVAGLLNSLAGNPALQVAPLAWASGIVVAVKK